LWGEVSRKRFGVAKGGLTSLEVEKEDSKVRELFDHTRLRSIKPKRGGAYYKLIDKNLKWKR